MSIRIERSGRGFRLSAETRLPLPVDEVFPFFADARNLDLLTPARVRFEILTPGEIPMAMGKLRRAGGGGSPDWSQPIPRKSRTIAVARRRIWWGRGPMAAARRLTG